MKKTRVNTTPKNALKYTQIAKYLSFVERPHSAILLGAAFSLATCIANSATLPTATTYDCNHREGCVATDARLSHSRSLHNHESKTRYPFMLIHGGGGYRQIIGTDYFYRIPQSLAQSGATVFQATLPAFHNADIRGEYLLQQLQTAQAITSAEPTKFNLIGHSMGGFDARYAAGTRPEMVASVTTLSTPHHGTGVADALKTAYDSHLGRPLIEAVLHVLNTVGNLLASAQDTDMPQDASELLNLVNEDGANTFNTRFPDGEIDGCASYQQPTVVNQISYYSWSGDRRTTNLLDPSDAALNLSGLLIKGDNDGLSPRCSTHWGYVVRDDYFLNHYDTVNLFFGLRSLFSPDPVALVRSHASRLKNTGL